jgi:hypothetical protein
MFFYKPERVPSKGQQAHCQHGRQLLALFKYSAKLRLGNLPKLHWKKLDEFLWTSKLWTLSLSKIGQLWKTLKVHSHLVLRTLVLSPLTPS